MDKGMRQIRPFVVHVFLPFLLGIGIYVLWRPTNLLFFHWTDAWGYFPIVSDYREMVSFVIPYLPGWFLNSLPAALFLYSLTSWFQIVWVDCYGKEWLFWISVALLVGVLSEVFQYYHLLSGKYDLMDVLFYVVAWILGVYIPKEKVDVSETP